MEITLLYNAKKVMFLVFISFNLWNGKLKLFFRPADLMEKLSFKKFGCSYKNAMITAVIIVGIKVCFKQTFELCNAEH